MLLFVDFMMVLFGFSLLDVFVVLIMVMLM